jgi:hypothetical protein
VAKYGIPFLFLLIKVENLGKIKKYECKVFGGEYYEANSSIFGNKAFKI